MAEAASEPLSAPAEERPKPLDGERAMTPAERQRKHRSRLEAKLAELGAANAAMAERLVALEQLGAADDAWRHTSSDDARMDLGQRCDWLTEELTAVQRRFTELETSLAGDLAAAQKRIAGLEESLAAAVDKLAGFGIRW